MESARQESHEHYFATIVSTKTVHVTRLEDGSSSALIGRGKSGRSVGQGGGGEGSSQDSWTTASLERVSSVSLRVDVTCHSVVTVQPWYHEYAEVMPVESPSKPVAPDGKEGNKQGSVHLG